MLFTNESGTFEHCQNLPCPACGLPLARSVGAPIGSVFVYCPHGVCKSQICNNGATGRDVETAREIIATKFEGLTPTTPDWENSEIAQLVK